MMANVHYQPKGFGTVIPYLTVSGIEKAIRFYTDIFGAEKIDVFVMPDGKPGHAELKIGDSKIMLGEEQPKMGMKGPRQFGGSPVGMHLYVEDVDETMERALKAGAKLEKSAQDQFYGDRSGCITDPFGHVWYLATHIEDMSRAEMHKRGTAAMKKMEGMA